MVIRRTIYFVTDFSTTCPKFHNRATYCTNEIGNSIDKDLDVADFIQTYNCETQSRSQYENLRERFIVHVRHEHWGNESNGKMNNKYPVIHQLSMCLYC